MDANETGAMTNPFLQDVEMLLQKIQQFHPQPYHEIPAEQWEETVAAVRDRLTADEPEYRKIIEFFRIVALLHDSHSRVGLQFEGDHSQMSMKLPEIFNLAYPLETYVFADGIFVIKAADTQLLGRKLMQINGESIETIIKRLQPLMPVENDMGVMIFMTYYLRPIFLYAIGSLHDLLEPITISWSDGRTSEVEPVLDPVLMSIFEYQNHQKDPLADTLLPKYLRYDPPLSIRQEGEELIVDIRSIRDAPDKTLRQLAEELDGILSQPDRQPGGPAAIQRLLIDLRGNGGGNNMLTQPLVQTIIKNDWINHPGRLFVLIDRWTFSAAINTANFLERDTWALFAGEPFAGRVNHFGDTTSFILPYSGVEVRISTLYWQDSDPTDTRVSIIPDLWVRQTFEQYRSRQDAVREGIRAYELDAEWLEYYQKYSPRYKQYRQSQQQQVRGYWHRNRMDP